MHLPMVASAYDANINGIYYNFDQETKTAKVTSYRYASSSNVDGYAGAVIIPATVNYNGKKYDVTGIDDMAFNWCSGLKSITIPNSVTSIGYAAFGRCSSLKSVTIPNSVTSIAQQTFWGCTGLTTVTIPNNVTSIAYEAFGSCSNLKSITIPNSVTSIAHGAFNNCSSLTNIAIPNSLTDIGASAFDNTGWYNNQPDGILYLDNWLIGVKGEKPMGKFMIAEGTIGLSGSAFSGCDGLTSVTIPNSVIYISNGYSYNNSYYGCFSGCRSLTSVTIPNSVTSIGHFTFYECSGLATVKIPNSVTSIGGYAFYGCNSLTSVTIPNSVTSIQGSSFYGCSGLSTVTIPNSVTSIGGYAFYGCSRLTSVTIPNSITSIGEYAFSQCSCLTSITLPSNVTSIAPGSFRNCNSLTSVVIPGSVKEIGIRAFEGCYQINSLYLSDLSAWCNFSNSSSPIIPSKFHLYLNNVEVENLTIPSDITCLGNYAFYGCSYITSIIIPNSVTTIGESSFENCSRVEKLKLPDNLQIIKKAAFKGCNSLKSLAIPPTVEVIYQEAFSGNNKMESVKALPETPPFLYDNSFTIYNIPLYVPAIAISNYQSTSPWSKFTSILPHDGQEVEQKICAKPTINYKNWELTFECETDGAEIVSEVTCNDKKKSTDCKLNLTPTYTIAAYARADGYLDSEFATATISWVNGRPVVIQGTINMSTEEDETNCDVNKDGTVDVADIATIISEMAAMARKQCEHDM